tara:strand:+ start:380 stop:790 length:411 start_codon:yes stop_codon:yes gene_type:complete
MEKTTKVAQSTQTTTLPTGRFGSYSSNELDNLVQLVPSTNTFIDGKGSESPFEVDATTEVVNEDKINVIKWTDGSNVTQYLFLQVVKCINTGLTDSFPFNPTDDVQKNLTKVGITNFIRTSLDNKGKRRSKNVEIK